MDDRHARLIRHLLAGIDDTLRTAATLAGRASELLDGQDGVVEFDALRRAISEFQVSSVAIKVVRGIGNAPFTAKD